jgi:lipopolysaccharide transport system permease protein
MTATRDAPIAAAEPVPRLHVGPTADPPLHRTVIEPRRHGLGEAWREFWSCRWFAWYFGHLFLTKRYARTWLGWLWVPLRPSMSVAARILVFGGLVGISSSDAPYPVFFLVASAAWQLFAEAVYWSTRSLELARGVLQRIEIPRLPVLVGAAVPSLIEFAIYAGLAGAALIYYAAKAGILYISFSGRTLLVPAGLVLALLLGLGIGLLTATIGARARDVRFGVQFALSFLYFLTPVIYPLSQVPNKYRPLTEINPMTGAIEMVKDGLFASHELSPDAAYVTIGSVVLLWIPVLWLFHRADVSRMAQA